MAQLNDNYLKLQAGYLFPEIGRRVNSFIEANPDADVIRLGIGDVTEPLPPAIIAAMHDAVDEMGHRDTFRGYGPEQGYEFLRDTVASQAFGSRGVDVSADEIFISDGSKCDTGNILDIFGAGNTVAVIDPVYPVYVDTNVMAGRTGNATGDGRFEGLVYLPVTAENNFVAPLPDRPVDLAYLCYPNNPTGTVASRDTLTAWVDYARANDTILLFDAAYEAYITDPEIPHSIYEIDGAREVAIEFRSFSKNAGFTGIRCACTVIPHEDGRTDRGARPLEPSAQHQVQRRLLPRSTRCRSGLQLRRARASRRIDQLLPRKCQAAPGRTPGGRNLRLRWNQCALRLAQDTRQRRQLDLLRPIAPTGSPGWYARQWFWSIW